MMYTCIKFRTSGVEKYCWSKTLKCFGGFHNFTKVVGSYNDIQKVGGPL